MLNKTVQEILFELESYLYQCSNSGDLKKKIVEIAMVNNPYIDTTSGVINIDYEKFKGAVIKHLDCVDDGEFFTTCVDRNCIYTKECNFLKFVLSLSGLLSGLSEVPSNLKIDVLNEEIQQ